VPTPEQKYGYLAMLLGGAEARFRETFSLFGGIVTVTFRNLAWTDGNLAQEQLRVDHERIPLAGELTYINRITQYRMALALEQVTFRGAGITTVPLATATDDDKRMARLPNAVVLPELVHWIRDKVLVSESLNYAVLSAFQEFQRLVEALSEKAEDPDFWKGIAAPR
jgi:hypothetical protein